MRKERCRSPNRDSSARLARALNGKVGGVDLEPESFLCLAREFDEEIGRDIDSRCAPFADQVAVGNGGQVVAGGPVPEVDVDDDVRTLKLFEIPIDGRQVHVWCQGLDTAGEILCGRVAVALDQCSDDGPPGDRHPQPASSQESHDVLDGRIRHVARIGVDRE